MNPRAEKSSRMRFALIGCGRIAQSHLDAFIKVEDAWLTMVVESRSEVGTATAERFNCSAVTDFRDPQVLKMADAVIICAPPNLHFQMAEYFLQNGKHVLCEKPLTLKSKDARELIALAQSKGLHLMMASKFRYAEDVIKAKAILQSGILGHVILYENTFCSKVPMKDRWNAKKDISGGGVLIDNGCHSVDIARYLLGPVKEIQVQNGIAAQNLEVEDTVRIQFRTQTGVMGVVDLSWSVNKESDTYIALFGSEGTLFVGWSASKYKQDGSSKWVNFGTGYNKVDAFTRQLNNFVETIRGTEMPLISPVDALASVEAIETAYDSLNQNKWLPIGDQA
jgi:predicted dehydrogenase